MDVQDVKRRFEIIGHSAVLDRAIEIAMQVAPTSLTVLITGESGVGKESFPKIIHQLSTRKHGPYIAVNCGAIPEGTIDSELFGHEKGSFTGAHEARKGYFEVADGGTIFLDEVAELPLSTQVRLLRVLESGEFLKVGSSKVQKTDVRVVAATNVNVQEAVQTGKFRQDLYYRLNTVPIHVPSLRERKLDIPLLFRKFAKDFSETYRMPVVRLDDKAQILLENYSWTGNVRQLKNITEQISILEHERNINAETLKKYLPEVSVARDLPILYAGHSTETAGLSERDLLYKILFDMRKDITDLKRVVAELAHENQQLQGEPFQRSVQNLPEQEFMILPHTNYDPAIRYEAPNENDVEEIAETETVEEPLLLKNREKELIEKALIRHNGKRKPAAKELGVSERTLYRKIKEYDLEHL